MSLDEIKIHDCWNKIGTRSSKGATCERLTDVINCINCDVYIQAGRRLLHREVPEGYLEEWANVISSTNTSEKAETQSAIIFKLQNQLVALPSRILDKVIIPGSVHTLPHNHFPYLIGVTNVQGELAVHLDLSRLLFESNLCVKPLEESRFPRHVVINLAGGLWAFEVEKVIGIERITYETLDLDLEQWNGDKKFVDSFFLWRKQQVVMLSDTVIEDLLKGMRM
ncbi:hypothetical protein MNBD_GAMMA16-1289 [hydrothermal vent metagenome]|uniref:CheW-like domain-containing protein n=1 Tax=hydrothermal vent metagenome TaxID=652676 RepID=A0A3B0Z838_9ZZZZ